MDRAVDYRLIGRRIQKQRKSRGYTQEYLAELLDVSVGYVSQVERGATKISLDLLAAICGRLACDIGQIVSGSAGAAYLQEEFAGEFSTLTEREKRIVMGLISTLKENRGT